MSASPYSQNVGADRNATALMATFDMAPITGAGVVSIRTIQLDFYCRYFTIRARQQGAGPVPVMAVGYSKEAVLGVANSATDPAGFELLFPNEPELRRFFRRDDEGPPYIWVANLATNGIIRCHFEYYPTKKRQGSHPMPTRLNRDFPVIVESTAIIQPGV